MNTRNFWWLVPPHHDQRGGRYFVGGSDPIELGAPVVATGDPNENGQRGLVLATAGVAPLRGKHGILWWETPYGARAKGFDPITFAQGDLHEAPVGDPCQLISGDQIRFHLKNTDDDNFEFQQEYDGFAIVDADFGATPTVAVDTLLCPGPGNSTGLWKPTNDRSLAWAVVTNVYSDSKELDAQLLF